MAGSEDHIAFQLRGNQFAWTCVDRAYIDPISLGIGGAAPISKVKKVFTVRKEERPAVRLNASLAHLLCHRSSRSAAGWHALQGPPKGRPKHNRALAIPSASPCEVRITKNLNSAAGYVYCF